MSGEDRLTRMAGIAAALLLLLPALAYGEGGGAAGSLTVCRRRQLATDGTISSALKIVAIHDHLFLPARAMTCFTVRVVLGMTRQALGTSSFRPTW